jgi:periplasmic divalent cation tolerance protein
MPALLVTCACPDAATAERLARTLVDARIAACVQLLPGVRSVYRWEGAVEAADEVLLLVKTWDDRLGALTEAIRAAHPYALPEIMAVPAVGGLAAYLDWVRDETRPPGADEIVE